MSKKIIFITGIIATIILGCILQHFACCYDSSLAADNDLIAGDYKTTSDSVTKEELKNSFINDYNQDPLTIFLGLGQIEQALDSSADLKLNDLYQFLEANPDVFVSVLGYGDSTGTRARNLIITRQRAEYVKSLLVAKGISSDRIEAIGKGDQNPVGDNNTEEGRAKNRRVEIIIK